MRLAAIVVAVSGLATTAAAPAAPTSDTVDAAVAALRAHGFPDVAGSTYRVVSVELTDASTGRARPTQIHAFVLPAGKAAVGWNGVVYPVISVGGPADVGADIDAMLANTSHHGQDEVDLLDAATPTAVKPVLLAELGDRARAERAWRAELAVVYNFDFPPLDRPLYGWVRAQYEHGLWAHVRGDRATALSAWSAVAQLVASVPRSKRFDRFSAVDGLIADERRRTAPRPASGSTRVSAAIDTLDDLVATDFRSLRDALAPTLGTLVAAGEPAVDILIDTLAHDDRYTRAVAGPSEVRRVISVHELAEQALRKILGDSFFRMLPDDVDAPATDAEHRRRVIAGLRARWPVLRKLAPVERAFAVLADPNTAPHAAVAAANEIVREPAGAALRTRTAPSIDELLARRIATDPWQTACDLGELFATWSPAAARPVLVPLSRALVAHWPTVTTADRRKLGDCILNIARVRTMLGDPDPASDYAPWLTTLVPYDLNDGTSWVAPLARFHHDPRAIRAADALFGPHGTWSDWHSLLESDLYVFPSFAQRVLAMLADRSPAGTFEILSNGEVHVTHTATGEVTTMYDDAPGPDVLPVGTRAVARAADLAALAMRGISRPEFRLTWTQPRRDRAIAELIRWIKAQ